MDKLRHKAFIILEGHQWTGRLSTILNAFLLILILINVAAVTLETVHEIYQQHVKLFALIELISVMVFTVEYLARLWVCVEDPDNASLAAWKIRMKFATSPMGLIDLLAILPFYLFGFGVLTQVDLRYLRLIRLIRILKLTRYSHSLQTFIAVFKKERRILISSLVIIVMALICASGAIYAIERHAQPDVFSSIPAAMWWAMATLTTVGYGDVVPVTVLGKVVGSFVMLSGIGIFVLWTSLFASSFSEEIKRRGFAANWQMLTEVPVFSSLNVVQLGEVVNLMQPLVVPARYMIERVGENNNAMFLIVDGLVEVEIMPEPALLKSGDHFGEMALIDNMPTQATIIALEETKLLMLDKDSFHDLLAKHDDLKKAFHDVVKSRRHWLKEHQING